MRIFVFIFPVILFAFTGYPLESLARVSGQTRVQTQDHCKVKGYTPALPVSYLSQFLVNPNQKLSAKLEGNEIVFYPPLRIKGATCFTGSPLKLSLEESLNEKYYFLTLRANKDEEKIKQCIEDSQPGVITLSLEGERRETKPLIWGVSDDYSGANIPDTFELGLRTDNQPSCFRGQDSIFDRQLLITKKGDDKTYWEDIVSCSDCTERVFRDIQDVLSTETGSQAEQISRILRASVIDSFQEQLEDRIDEIRDSEPEDGELDALGIDPLLDELKEFLWGGDGSAGLFSHYYELAKKSRKSEEEKTELVKVRNF